MKLFWAWILFNCVKYVHLYMQFVHSGPNCWMRYMKTQVYTVLNETLRDLLYEETIFNT